MKTKRVGILSMAIILIISGILILISQFLNISALEYFTKFWPLALVLLGIEVIYSYFKYRKNPNVKIGMDFLSVGIILIIFILNYGLYTFVETGYFNKFNSSKNQEVEIHKLGEREFRIGSDIEKIIIENFDETNLDIKIGNNNKLILKGDIVRKKANQEDFKKFLKDELIEIEESGKVLYLSINTNKIDEDKNDLGILETKIELTVPSTKMLEIYKVKDINLEVTKLDEDILINNANQVKININKPISYNILSEVDSEEKLNGTMDWITKEIKNIEGEVLYLEGKISKGESEHCIKINNANNIEVISL